MKRRFRVYIAGAMTPTGEGNHAIEFLTNIKKGIIAAVQLIREDFCPVCPMLDFQYFLCSWPHRTLTASEIYDVSVSLMLGCDAILLLPHAEKSKGWKNEKKIATEEKIPIFNSFFELIDAKEDGEIKCRS
jgi:hypothetical protein